MNPFEIKDYRAYLLHLCEQEEAPRGYRAQLARAAGCQASYFSQVLNQRCHLTEDQLLGIAGFLELTTLETDSLLLHLRKEKAGTKELRRYLEASIVKLKESQREMSNRLDAKAGVTDPEVIATFFASWIPSTVQLLTSSPDFRTAEKIAQRLNLPLEKIKETLLFLQRSGFVERTGNEWAYKSGNLHIPKDSPYQPAVQSTRRELAARSIALNPKEAVHFASVFTIDRKDFAEIREQFLKAIEKAHKTIGGSGTEQLACVCVDLFEVI